MRVHVVHMLIRIATNVILVFGRQLSIARGRAIIFPLFLSSLPDPEPCFSRTGNISCSEINSTLWRIITVQCAPTIRHGCKGGIPRSAAYHYGAHIHGCQTICQRLSVHDDDDDGDGDGDGERTRWRLTPNRGPRGYRIVCHLYAAVTGHARVKDRHNRTRLCKKRVSFIGVVRTPCTRYTRVYPTSRKKSANKRETCFSLRCIIARDWCENRLTPHLIAATLECDTAERMNMHGEFNSGYTTPREKNYSKSCQLFDCITIDGQCISAINVVQKLDT